VWIADLAATLAIFAFGFAFGSSSFYDASWSGAAGPALASGGRPFGPLDALAAAVGVVAMRLPRPPRWA